MSELSSEAQVAKVAFELSRQLHLGEEAIIKLATIEGILDDLMARLPTLDPAVPWDALHAIRKAMR